MEAFAKCNERITPKIPKLYQEDKDGKLKDRETLLVRNPQLL